VGILLDSCVLIGAERAGQNPRAVVEDLLVKLGDGEATLSIITLVELAHGIDARTRPRAGPHANSS
jgi:hypothetical protein